MTFGRYKRLLLVVTLPLLLVGSGLAFALSPSPLRENILCPQYNWCRTYPASDVRDQLEKMVAEAKVRMGDDLRSLYITLDRDTFRFGRYDIISVGTAVKDATMIAYRPYLNSSEAANTLAESWIGTKANILLGIGPGRSLYGGGYPVSLDCYSLEILSEQNLYRVGCAMRDSDDGGWFTFAPPAGADTQFTTLVENIEASVSDHEFDRIMYIVLVYPSLLYGFLILSGLVWLTRRAMAFVVAG